MRYVRRRPAAVLSALLVGVLASLLLAVAPASAAEGAPEDAARELALKYAPYVRLQQDVGDCDQGEKYVPTDVDAVLDDPEVALRGPWSGAGVLEVAPTADDLEDGPPSYFLDYPGDAL